MVIGVNTPNGQTSISTQIYEDVDSGEARHDFIELYRGKPDGIALTILLMEHDEGDPNKYKELMDQAVEKGGVALVGLLSAVPVVGWVLGAAAGLALAEFGDDVADFLNSLLGTDDDRVNAASIVLTTKQMVVLAARTPNSVFSGIGFKVDTPMISGQGGDYKVFFGLGGV